jgi:hypothetical protein
MNLALRQTAQPVKSLFANGFARCGRHLGDHGEPELREAIGRNQHFVRIAKDARPSQVPNAIHNLGGAGSGVSQIATVEDQVGREFPQIREDGLKCGSVAVDVGYDRDPHRFSVSGPMSEVRRPSYSYANASMGSFCAAL